ncbi:MAG: HlyD family efflux transporter periplasmic adaptor subunit, partial [Paracoccus sp. (in: a-proteobacteria)]|nr:HlyD family efflux transporter periplasmic adaptor subunit [Paracoccus sp. (in: a-proteobacteria)]
LQLEMARAEADQAATQVELAALRAQQAEAEAARLAPLARADAIPQRQADEARNAARLAEIELRAARQSQDLALRRIEVNEQELDARTVRAPVSGVILRRTAREGDATTTATVTEMFLLAPDGPRVLHAQLDEQFVGLVAPGQSAEILRERDDGSRLRGTVQRVAGVFGSIASAGAGGTVAPRGSDEARTVEIVIRLDGPQNEIDRLVLGQRLIARIEK